MRRLTISTLIISALLLASAVSAGSPDWLLSRIKLPSGFEITYFSDDVPNARSLALGDSGTVFVGNRSGDKVYALVDGDGDGVAERRFVIAEHLDTPNGVAFYKGALYVAEHHRIIRFNDIEKHLARPPKPEVIYNDLPKKRHHGWRYLAVGPDGWLYLSIGAPCNICNEPQPFATICRLRPDGSGFEVYAEGVRNSIGLTWHPRSRMMWFTDNGRDWLGDDAPPDELNLAEKKGGHYGYPFIHGKNIADPEFGESKPERRFTPPALELEAHVAALGLRFYTGSMFPPEYQNRLFIAQHGSWNRTIPTGYRIISVTVDQGRVTDKSVFAEGWLFGILKWGRPVDLLVMPDGSLLLSDDLKGAVYRISYQPLK
jgi:glucose/arabinose dehydrogenase